MKKLLVSGIVLVALGAAGPTLAADITPIYKAPTAAVASNGFYVWADGSWQQVNLPSVSLSAHPITPVVGLDLGPIDSIRARVDGFGVRGGVGYILPNSVWGSNTRIEVGAKYVNAKGTQSEAFNATGVGGLATVLLSGAPSGNNAFNCATFTCVGGAALTTDYQTWELNGRVATDFRTGPLLLTPSIAVFGGEGRNNQSLAQGFLLTVPATGVVLDTATYNAATALKWSDIGVRGGLDVSVPVNNWLTVGIGGYLGVAHRHTSLTGSDVNVAVPTGIFFNGASAIAASMDKTAFVANIEGGLNIQPFATRNVTLRGFGGANFDNAVPGISPAGYAGTVFVPTALRPAGIIFVRETNVYAGGGVVVRFP